MEQEPNGINTALMCIEEARGRLAATGAADSESGYFDTLKADLEAGKIGADEVMQRVKNVLEARQSYH